MAKHTNEEITKALDIICQRFDPLYNISEDKDKYLPLYCYTATSSYALGLPPDERNKTIITLRKLFDFFCNLTIDKTGKYHEQWEKFCLLDNDNHSFSASLHRSNACNFTEGKTFVCLGFPFGYYFDKEDPGQEFGEITYVIHGMYNFLKVNTDYNSIFFNDELKSASDLYERIINSHNNRRVYLKIRVKKSDVAYVTQCIREDNKASKEKIEAAIGNAIFNELQVALALKDDYKLAEPLGNCCYKLCDNIVEIDNPEMEREMAIKYLEIIKSVLKTSE